MGTSLKYVHDSVRGDLMGWFNGVEESYPWLHLPQFGKKVHPSRLDGTYLCLSSWTMRARKCGHANAKRGCVVSHLSDMNSHALGFAST